MRDFQPAERAVLAQKLLSNPLTFTRYFYKIRNGHDFVVNWHHEAIAKKLVSVFLGRTKRLIIEMPPQTGKSETCVVNFNPWTFAHEPDCRNMILSDSDLIIKEHSDNIRSIINTEEYSQLFNVRLQKNKNAIKRWRTNSDGRVAFVTTRGQVQGLPAGLISVKHRYSGCLTIDDALKPDDQYSKRKRDAAFRRVSQLINSRLATEEIPVIVVAQRLDDDDPIGRLKKENPTGWTVLKIPALINGESFWPWKYSTERLLEIKRLSPYMFSAEYMQEPALIESGLYKREYWQYYNPNALPQFEYLAIIGDTAQKKNEQNDFTVLGLVGGYKNRIYLLDLFREKLEAPELRREAVNFYEKAKYSTRTGIAGVPIRNFWVEDKNSGTGLIQELQRKGGIPIKAIKRSSDKIARAHDAIGQIEAGNLLLPESAPWLSDLLLETSLFPNAQHDDIVDVLNDAVNILLNSRTEPRIAIL